MTVTIYGIKNCDTMKKAFVWLESHGIAYRFRDYRAEGIEETQVRAWAAKLGWEKLLNKSSTTFRDLPASEKDSLDEAKAIELMVKAPTMIKRPVLVTDDQTACGFKPELYASIFRL